MSWLNLDITEGDQYKAQILRCFVVDVPLVARLPPCASTLRLVLIV